jgi:uncharacterized protein
LSPATIPQKPLGATGLHVSALGSGGHHLGSAASYEIAERIVAEAIEGGVTFFDNCWEYHNGRSEEWLGRALSVSGRRERIVLMTKVCTHGRDATLAMKMLDESLRRLRTDHLDVWQVHGMCFDNDPELAYRKGASSRRSMRRSAPARCAASASLVTSCPGSTSR